MPKYAKKEEFNYYPLKKKLFIYAFITAPILALYGIAPIYTFNILLLNDVVFLGFGLSFISLSLWGINIFLILKRKLAEKWQTYLLSFGIAYLLQLPRIYFAPVLPYKSLIEQFFVYPLIVTGAINTVILIICNTILTDQKRSEAEIEVEKLKVQNLEAQKQVLMQQLNPHFLFNSLSVLKSLIQEDTNNAENYAIKLSDFLRYSVESHKAELVSLQDELKFVNDYVELQKVRFEDAFTFTLDIPDALLNDKIPVFALQTLIENAFKHNYFTAKKPLHITISWQENRLKIWNNKVSMKVTERTGTGLANLKKRYELIMGKSIEIIETENDFCVMISLLEK